MLSESVPMTAVIRLIVQWARNPNLHQVKVGRQRRKFLKAIAPNTAYMGLVICLTKRNMQYDLYHAWFFSSATLNRLAVVVEGTEGNPSETSLSEHPGFGGGVNVCEHCGSKAPYYY